MTKTKQSTRAKARASKQPAPPPFTPFDAYNFGHAVTDSVFVSGTVRNPQPNAYLFTSLQLNGENLVIAMRAEITTSGPKYFIAPLHIMEPFVPTSIVPILQAAMEMELQTLGLLVNTPAPKNAKKATKKIPPKSGKGLTG